MDFSVFSKKPLSARSCLARFEIFCVSLSVLPLPKTSIKPNILILEDLQCLIRTFTTLLKTKGAGESQKQEQCMQNI